MYFVSVGALLFVFPVLSILAEWLVFHGAAPTLVSAGRWFVFWGVGARLFIAGIRQVLKPELASETILGIKDAGAAFFVRELGIANLSLGAIGLASVMLPGWVPPVAVAGGLFYFMAGVNHARHDGRNALQTFAMVTDFAIAALLLGYVASTAF